MQKSHTNIWTKRYCFPETRLFGLKIENFDELQLLRAQK